MWGIVRALFHFILQSSFCTHSSLSFICFQVFYCFMCFLAPSFSKSNVAVQLCVLTRFILAFAIYPISCFWNKSKVIPELNYLITKPWRGKAEWRYNSTILYLGTRWKRVVSRPCRLTPGERAPSIHCTGGWMGLRTGLDFMEKIKISYPTRNPSPITRASIP
jgi:hypothetical protein